MGTLREKCERQLKGCFEVLDSNKDGTLSPEEMRPLLDALAVPDDFAELVMKAFDTDGNGNIDYREFVSWIMAEPDVAAGTDDLNALHFFVQPDQEANMEKETLWNLRRVENDQCLCNCGFPKLSDPGLLVLSVGSSSTQVYDSSRLSASFPLGTQTFTEAALQKLLVAVTEPPAGTYTHVLLVNSIGYCLSHTDPEVVDLAELAARMDSQQGSVPDLVRGFNSLTTVLKDARICVHNRAKDPTTKKYKFPQLVNDFSVALAAGRLRPDEKFDAVVDWGGASYKIFVGGKRVSSEVFDANRWLCAGSTLDWARHVDALSRIKRHVLSVVPSARTILVAQTGKPRELALMAS